MARIPESLKQQCQQAPEEIRWVIVTVSEDSQIRVASDLGLEDGKEVAPGIFAGKAPGKKLLDLIKQQGIDEIIPDSEVSAHA